MTKRQIGHDYEISEKLWNKIKPLLPLPKPKKKPGRTEGIIQNIRMDKGYDYPDIRE
jgi:transposase